MRILLVSMLLVALNYASCEAIRLSSLREDDTNNEDEEEISCDDWVPPPGAALSEMFTLCEIRMMFCSEDGEAMIKKDEAFLKDPKGASKHEICLTKDDLDFVNPIVANCNQDIECDDVDMEAIFCDDWESPHSESDGWAGLSLCETRDLFCDHKGKDMVDHMKKILKDPKGASKDSICLVKEDLEVLEPIIKDCNKDIACDDKDEDE